MPICNDPNCGGPKASHVHMDENTINYIKGLHEAAKLSAAGDEIERTRNVDTSNYNDLLDHLKSDNGHMLDFAEWRNSHDDEHIPGVRPKKDDDRQLTHQELIALHHHDHNKWPDLEHTTLDGEHFHH